MNQSLVSICLGTLVRSVVLCLIAWPICVVVERWIRGLADIWRSYALGLLLAPFLVPELLLGYAYRDAALSSARLAECLCSGLLLIRIVPVGVVALLMSPSTLSNLESIYCRRMLMRPSFSNLRTWMPSDHRSKRMGQPDKHPDPLHELGQLFACYWFGPIRRAVPALGLMGIVAFQEFELAALLQTASWTDWFIVSQRVGLDRAEMLRQSLWPILIQLPPLVVVVYWFVLGRQRDFEQTDEPTVGNPWYRGWFVAIYFGLAMVFGCLLPLRFMALNLPNGIELIVRQPTQLTGLIREIVIAGSVSLCAGITAWLFARIVVEPKGKTAASVLLRQSALLPGLAGSLLLSLAMLVLFQQTWLRPLYDTPIPWVVSLTVWLLPRAVLVRLWLASITQTEGVHLAEMLVASRRSPSALLFRMKTQPQLLGIGLLCYWAYLDLSTACLLAPSGMPSGLVRLYNFMHFGRSSALSAESILFFGMPIVAAYVLARVCRAFR